MSKNKREITVVLSDPALEDKLAEKATLKLYELYMAAKARGELKSSDNTKGSNNYAKSNNNKAQYYTRTREKST